MKRFKPRTPRRSSKPAESIPQRFRLRFLFQEIDLPVGEITIGRSSTCTITLEDPLVSRHHGRVLVSTNRAEYEDLGSRNGTVINDMAVTSTHLLQDQDRLRIGSQELVFLNVTNRPMIKARTTGYLRVCEKCKAVFPETAGQCPQCGEGVSSDGVCHGCGAPVGPNDRICRACGASLSPDDSTIPVDIGGPTAAWRNQLISGVFDKAVAAGKLEQAGHLTDDLIRDFEHGAKHGKDVDRNVLRKLTRMNFRIAETTGDPDRIAWGIGWHKRLGLILHTSLVDILERITETRQIDLSAPIAHYLAELSQHLGKETLENDERIERLRQMMKRQRRGDA